MVLKIKSYAERINLVRIHNKWENITHPQVMIIRKTKKCKNLCCDACTAREYIKMR
jgi:hypothetical protein